MLTTCAMCSNSKRQFMKMVVSLLELLVKQMSPWYMYLYVQMVERRPVCILDCLCPGSVEQLWHHGAWLCHSHQKWIPKDGRDEAWNEQENESLQENDQTICTYRPLLSSQWVSITFHWVLKQSCIKNELWSLQHCSLQCWAFVAVRL